MTMAGERRLVCVTGASGFVGSHVTRELLQRGYHVRATVRDPNDDSRTAHLLRLAEEAGGNLEIRQADLFDPGSFDDVVSGCQGVFHVATATVLTAKNPQREIVDPAIVGTKNVLAAAARSGSVTRVVLTSSVAAVAGNKGGEGETYTEADWNDDATLSSDPYALAKTRAERLAWELVEQQSGDQRYDLVVLNPCYVLGPVYARIHTRSSPALIKDFLRGKLPACPAFNLNVVDARDVARAHVAAFEKADASGRYIVAASTMWVQELASALKRHFPERRIATRRAPNFLVYLTALIDKRLSIASVRNNLGRQRIFDGSRAGRELGIEYTPIDQTLLDCGQSMIDLGLLQRRAA